MIEERYPTEPRRSRIPADLGPRVAVAVPAALLLVLAVHAGGWVLAAPLAAVAAAGHLELARLARISPAAAAPGALAAAALPLLAQEGGSASLALGAAAGAPAAAVVATALASEHRGAAAGATLVGVLWLGGCLGHGVLLRAEPHGAALVVGVLLATFLGDTAAQFAGSAFGRRRLAPSISPNKTVEGLVAGIAVGTAACAVFLAAFHDWIGWAAALALGLACSLAAPVGDLFESALKRRAGVKDSGRAFGAHGGVLDRVDAALAAVLVGLYVALAVT